MHYIAFTQQINAYGDKFWVVCVGVCVCVNDEITKKSTDCMMCAKETYIIKKLETQAKMYIQYMIIYVAALVLII